MTILRPFEPADWPATWRILEPVFRAGDTYSFAADITEEEALSVWVAAPAATFVAEDEAGRIVGTYYLKANQPGQGAHVCNCGYVVGEAARGKGIASAMCEHSQEEAVRRGFCAMQYNLVVSSNTGAVRLWQQLGFTIVGTLPEAFRHPSLGFVDAYVMYKKLSPP
jgi:ribosomal protein S18 acetylase RimI-like enzyme